MKCKSTGAELRMGALIDKVMYLMGRLSYLGLGNVSRPTGRWTDLLKEFEIMA